ncbi:MAG TPA: CaiB/BaiF CoA-transferase family protein [Nocardioidaceae bacterium]|nr:CaiB/BaiF CoA-transferase family protein [Nocardioidaceae bacterium]
MSSGPLHGVRVVELAGIGPAPFAAMLLADLGADVIRIDRPGGGLQPAPPDYNLLARGRPSVAIDLKRPEGVRAVLDLVGAADVLLEGFRPGVAERLGLGPDDCHAVNPRLVYGRMTGWGQDGPLAQRAGHDIDYIALSGVLHGIGRAGGPPQIPTNLLGDFGGGGLYLVVGVLAALVESRASGQGQVVDAAIVDGSAHLATMIAGLVAGGVWRDERGVNLLDGGAPFYDVYETADGGHIALGALEPQFWQAFLDRLASIDVDVDELPDRNDLSTWPLLRKRLAETFATRTRDEWVGVFDGSDACVTPVLSMTEAAAQPHLAARGTYVDHAGVTQPAPAPRFSRTPATLSTPPTHPGADSAEALRRWGIGDVDALVEAGVVIQASTTGEPKE